MCLASVQKLRGEDAAVESYDNVWWLQTNILIQDGRHLVVQLYAYKNGKQ